MRVFDFCIPIPDPRGTYVPRTGWVSIWQETHSSSTAKLCYRPQKKSSSRNNGSFLSPPQLGTCQILAGNRGSHPQSIMCSELGIIARSIRSSVNNPLCRVQIIVNNLENLNICRGCESVCRSPATSCAHSRP